MSAKLSCVFLWAMYEAIAVTTHSDMAYGICIGIAIPWIFINLEQLFMGK